MNSYEHLLSKDPIGAFEKITENYIRYFENAYKLKNEELNQKRIDLLRQNDNLYKSPFIELLPEYNVIEGIDDIAELADEFEADFGSKDSAKKFFDSFIKLGLMDYVPYVHQIDMMRKVFSKKDGRYNNAVITTGTGSGKTESFLLPLLAQLFKEAVTWDQVTNDKAWATSNKTLYEPRQRTAENGKKHIPAVRALIMYPMNALVEDQISRLRKALDSDKVRKFFDSIDGLKGNRIYFGSYNGATIGNKNYELIRQHPDPDKLKSARRTVQTELNELHEYYRSIQAYYNSNPGKEDVLYTSPRLDCAEVTSEMVTRWDMQTWAPDILITNTSMLSIMLMRQAEENIFEQTRKWLAAEDVPEMDRAEAKKERIFHVVIDELHLYRDTPGSETACLIRMLLNKIGLPPVINGAPNPQLRILASSASLGTEEDTHKYLEEFFGVYNGNSTVKAFNVVPNKDEYNPNYEPSKDGAELDYEKFSFFTPSVVAQPEDEQLKLVNEFAAKFGCCDAADFIGKYERTIFSDLLSLIPRNEDGSKRGLELDKLIYKDETSAYLFETQEALRGFLIFRGIADSVKDKSGKVIKHRLPRIRFHQFYKYVEGLWGELQNMRCGGDSKSPIGDLAYMPQELGPNGRKVLEMLRCECCGELFIGGSRKIRDGRTYMTLNYPDLNKIPSFNPTPMVQNKSYGDYVLFWPSCIQRPDIEMPREYDHFSLLGSGETSYVATNNKAIWTHAYLNVYTGEIKSSLNANDADHYVEGFLLGAEVYDTKVGANLDNIHALPCCCPHCKQNYTNRNYTKSPIRSFRTGIDRSNQILSKELMYQLREGNAKLIGFSDSRQDAAKQAIGIEEEHYRDMVRALFLDSIIENELQMSKMLSEIRDAKQDGKDDDDILDELESIYPYESKTIRKIVRAIYKDEEDRLNSLIPSTISMKNLIGKGNRLDGILLKKLVGLGINPAGVDYKNQQYALDGSDDRHHWSKAFKFPDYSMNDTLDFAPTPDASLSYAEVRRQLSAAVFENSFGRYMGVSTLDTGIGYVCCRADEEVKRSSQYVSLNSILSKCAVDTMEFVDAFVRVLGDHYRYDSPDFKEQKTWAQYSDLSQSVKKPIDKFAEIHALSDAEKSSLQNNLFAFLSEYACFQSNILLQFDKLSFKRMTEKDKYYKCPDCGRVHPNLGFGFCTNVHCCALLKDDAKYTGIVKDLHNHFISYDILVERREPMRLHTEELSGQTDNIKERLLHFKDIVMVDQNNQNYRSGMERSLPIDMINVTTTMEVGVDIGSLEAIFQGNMPPTRYNYQQRVGRGGRRGQAFSAAVTFCRGRSHDLYYYHKATDEIVGGMPMPPQLSLSPYMELDGNGIPVFHMKLSIMKRVVVKEILNMAFNKLRYDYDLNDTCGEFGRVYEWKNGTTKDVLIKWLAANVAEVDKVVDYYFAQFNTPQQDVTKDIDELKTWIKTSMVTAINSSIDKEADVNKGLAQSLSEMGFLPMYGMPSDVRSFYHGTGVRRSKKYVKNIDRSTELSITEYAPGSEKCKDKGVYRVEALTIPMDYVKNSRGIEQLSYLVQDNAPGEEYDALKDKYVVTYDQAMNYQNREGNILSIEPVNNNVKLAPNQRLVVIPRAYRSYAVEYNSGTPIDNSDRTSSFAQGHIWAKDDADPSTTNCHEIKNVRLSEYGFDLRSSAEVWHVNSNNNRFFRGKYARLSPPYYNGTHTWKPDFTFFTENVNRGARQMSPIPANDSDSFEIALGAKKPTEMVKLELLSCPASLCLDVHNDNCNVSAVRAAFYSAAFILQRVLADKLDVQPDEIEISEKILAGRPYPILYLNDALPNGAGIVSYLAKPGKFEEMIQDIIQFKNKFVRALVSHPHYALCKTACQNCLMAYNNRGFHHVLDWRLGIGILRLMVDPEFDFGFTSSNHEELNDLNELIVLAAKKKNAQLVPGERYWKKPGSTSQPWAGGNSSAFQVFYHPLWDKQATVDALDLGGASEIEMYNIFDLLRSNVVCDRIISNRSVSQPTTNQSQMTSQPNTPVARTSVQTSASALNPIVANEVIPFDEDSSNDIIEGIDLE